MLNNTVLINHGSLWEKEKKKHNNQTNGLLHT